MADFTEVIVTGTFTLADGTPAAGAVDFLLTAELTNAVTGAEVPATTITAPLDAQGRLRDPETFALGVTLTATTDPTTTPTGATYRVIERITGTDPLRVYYITVPHTAPGGTVVLGLLVPGGTAPPVHYELTGITMPTPFVVTRAAGQDVVTWDSGAASFGDVLTYDSPTAAAWVPLGSLGGDKRYTHVQNSAATTWVVTHNLGKIPAITVFDSAGTRIEAGETPDTPNQTTLTFAYPLSGTAYCN